MSARSWWSILLHHLGSDMHRIDVVLDTVYGERVCAMCNEVFKGDSDVCPRCDLDLLPLPFTDKLEEDE